MFDNEMLEVQSTRETLFLRLKCVCVCVCLRARVRVCLRARVCVCVRGALQASGASKRSNTHTINGIFVSLFNFVHVLTLSYLMYIKHKKCLHTAAFTNLCFIFI